MLGCLGNLLIILAFGALYWITSTAGPVLCTAWLLGYFFCYIQFKNWHKDHEEPEPIYELTKEDWQDIKREWFSSPQGRKSPGRTPPLASPPKSLTVRRPPLIDGQ